MEKSLRYFFGGLAGCVVLVLAGAAFGETVGFDADWEFALKDFWVSYGKVGMCKPQNNANDNGTPRVAADSNGWTRVTLPHDWALGLDYAEKGTRNGFKAVGKGHPQNNVGWYRKHFAVPKEADGKRVFIRFDGVYRDAQFWMNGIYLGRNESGYLGRCFEITDFVRFGEADNFVSVRVDASKDEGWWYDGAGIVRHVWLEYKDADGLVPDSVFIRVKELRDGVAVMRVDYECLESGKGGYDFEVKEPRLWSPDDPHLYTLELKGEKFTYGIRTVVFDPDRGMLVNGRRVEVRGVCCHQDHAGLGVALPDAIVEYRVRLLKKMGVNAYRTSHNPPSPVLLDMCDRYGIVVMDETRLFASSAEGLDQFSRLIRRDRNHPSVVAYSVGNEEHNVQSTETGRRMAETMKRVQRALDPTRVITYGGNNGVTHEGINEVTDVRGVNYIRLAKVDEGEFDKYHADHPTTPVWGSEEASTLTTRGAEVFAGARQVLPDLDIPATRPNGWSYGAEEWTTRAAARPWFAGAFAWTGFDYRGECHWPAINCNFGILDLCGFPKNNAWYYRARWTDGDVLHVYPHANAARTNFWVNTNCDRVELFVNGKSVGAQTRADGTYRLSFPVDFTRGEVVARGVRKGREVVTRIVTSGRFAKLALKPDRTALAADGADATVVNLTALDADGNEVPDCNERLYFTLDGDGEILGVGNGDPLDHDADLATAAGWTRRLFNGRCQVVVRSSCKAGLFVLRAQSDTVPPSSAEIKTVAP